MDTWFLLLYIAALTSIVALSQPAIAFFEDEFGWSRKHCVWGLGVFFLLSVPITMFVPGVIGELDFWGGTVALVFLALFEWSMYLAFIGVIGIIFTAAYYLWMLQRTVFGDVNPELSHAHDVSHWSQYSVLGLLSLLTLLLGLFPAWLLDLMTTATEFFAKQF